MTVTELAIVLIALDAICLGILPLREAINTSRGTGVDFVAVTKLILTSSGFKLLTGLKIAATIASLALYYVTPAVGVGLAALAYAFIALKLTSLIERLVLSDHPKQSANENIT